MVFSASTVFVTSSVLVTFLAWSQRSEILLDDVSNSLTDVLPAMSRSCNSESPFFNSMPPRVRSVFNFQVFESSAVMILVRCSARRLCVVTWDHVSWLAGGDLHLHCHLVPNCEEKEHENTIWLSLLHLELHSAFFASHIFLWGVAESSVALTRALITRLAERRLSNVFWMLLLLLPSKVSSFRIWSPL